MRIFRGKGSNWAFLLCLWLQALWLKPQEFLLKPKALLSKPQEFLLKPKALLLKPQEFLLKAQARLLKPQERLLKPAALWGPFPEYPVPEVELLSTFSILAYIRLLSGPAHRLAPVMKYAAQ
jgi:hypothetical protein